MRAHSSATGRTVVEPAIWSFTSASVLSVCVSPVPAVLFVLSVQPDTSSDIEITASISSNIFVFFNDLINKSCFMSTITDYE